MGAVRNHTSGAPGHICGPAIGDLSDVGKLRVVDPERDGRIPVLLEAIRILAREVGDEVSIRGNADQSAFSLAGLLRGTGGRFILNAGCAIPECTPSENVIALIDSAREFGTYV